MKCRLCEEEFSEEKKFHFHVARKHKIRIEQYYRQFYPRFDLLTGEGLKFKDKDFYFSSLCNTRQNLITYLKENPSARTTTILKTLDLRKRVKSLRYAPSTVEARTSILPTPALLDFFKMDYNACCERVGLTPRYDYSAGLGFNAQNSDFNILVDTREQKPLDFGCETFRCKLDYGDYTSRSNYNHLFVERKSLVDLCGTLSQGYDRVRKEFDRCKAMDGYIVVCVEAPISALDMLRRIPETSKVKASSEFLAHRMREICQEYPCVQFLFVKNRNEMAPIIKKLFLMQNDFRKVDMQYAYDCERLTA